MISTLFLFFETFQAITCSDDSSRSVAGAIEGTDREEDHVPRRTSLFHCASAQNVPHGFVETTDSLRQALESRGFLLQTTRDPHVFRSTGKDRS
jgi:hypothetical protein